MEKKFDLIHGGRSEEPKRSKEQLAEEIANDVGRQGELTFEEGRVLLDKMNAFHLRGMRESIARHSDRILTMMLRLFVIT